MHTVMPISADKANGMLKTVEVHSFSTWFTQMKLSALSLGVRCLTLTCRYKWNRAPIT